MVSIREKKKVQNQQRILEAAFRLFNDQGFRKTTITQIAREADMGTGTVYNYFPSKEHLLAAIIRETATQNIASFEDQQDLDDPLDETLLLFEIIFKGISVDRNLQRESISAIFLPPGNGPSSPKDYLTSEVDEMDFYIIDILSSILQKGKETGKLKSSFSEDIVAMTIYSSFMFCWFKYAKGYFKDLETAKKTFLLMIDEIFCGLGYLQQ